jgi:DNA modification methylase
MWQGMLRAGERIEREHPTQKPVELMVWILRDLAPDIRTLLDLFVGSGTTLIAAEQLNRVCYGMEIEPKYCDVIVTRYCNFVGSNKVIRNGKEINWKT